MHLKCVTGANAIALISEICHSASIREIKGGGGAERGPGVGLEKVLGWILEMTIRSRNAVISAYPNGTARIISRLMKPRKKNMYLQCFLKNGHPESNNCRDLRAIVKKEVLTVMGNRATCNLNVIAGRASPT